VKPVKTHFPRLAAWGVIAATFCAALAACKPINPNDLPVSHWADPKTIGADGFGYADGCSVASAQAIVKSGLPYPNYGTKDEWDAYSKTMQKRITTVDFWLGGVRFVFPAEIASSDSYLEGGAGTDSYTFDSNFGNDTITDSDGLGSIQISTITATGGKKVTNNVWQSDDKTLVYTQAGSEAGTNATTDSSLCIA
jgi:hypothetical protein